MASHTPKRGKNGRFIKSKSKSPKHQHRKRHHNGPLFPHLSVNNSLAKVDPQAALQLMAIKAQTQLGERNFQRGLKLHSLNLQEQKHAADYAKKVEDIQRQRQMLSLVDHAFNPMGFKAATSPFFFEDYHRRAGGFRHNLTAAPYNAAGPNIVYSAGGSPGIATARGGNAIYGML